MSKLVLSLTGHRPNKLDGYKLYGSNHLLRPYYQRLYNRLVLAITNALAKYDTVECHSGMALGADTIWALAIVAMKEQYPNRLVGLEPTKLTGKNLSTKQIVSTPMRPKIRIVHTLIS